MAIAWLEVFTSFANSFDVSSVIPMFIGLKSIGIPIWVFPFHLEVPSLTLWRLPLVGIFPICSSSIAFLFPTKTSLTLLSHISYSWLPPFSRFSWQGSWISRLLSFSVHVHRFFFFLTRFFFFFQTSELSQQIGLSQFTVCMVFSDGQRWKTLSLNTQLCIQTAWKTRIQKIPSLAKKSQASDMLKWYIVLLAAFLIPGD